MNQSAKIAPALPHFLVERKLQASSANVTLKRTAGGDTIDMGKHKNRRGRRPSGGASGGADGEETQAQAQAVEAADERRGSSDSVERSDESDAVGAVEVEQEVVMTAQDTADGAMPCGGDGCCAGDEELGGGVPAATSSCCANESDAPVVEDPMETSDACSDACCSSKEADTQELLSTSNGDADVCVDDATDNAASAFESNEATSSTKKSCCASKTETATEPAAALSSCCASADRVSKKTKGSTDVGVGKAAAKSSCASKSATSACCNSAGSDTDSVSSVKSSTERAAGQSSCCASKDKRESTTGATKGCCAEGSTEQIKGCCSSGTPNTSGGCVTTPTVSTKGCKSSSSCCSSVREKIDEDRELARPAGPGYRAGIDASMGWSDSFVHRVTEFKNDRGATLAASRIPHATKRMSTGRSSGEVATLKLCIGGMTCNGCCTRIESFMLRKPGIADVNVSLLTSRGVFQYDPRVLSPQVIEDWVRGLGFKPAVEPEDDIASIVLLLGRSSSSLQATQLLSDCNGITSATVTDDPSTTNSGALRQNAVLVDYDPAVTGARAIVHDLSSKLGFPVQATSPRPRAATMGEEDVRKFTKLLMWSCLLTLPVVIMEFVLPLFLGGAKEEGSASPLLTEIIPGLTVRDAVGLACATPVEFWIAYSIHESAYSALRHSSRVTMDVLISLSSFTAYAFSVLTIATQVFDLSLHRSDTFFEVTVMLITLILFGRYIEKRVKATASNSVDALLRIQAKTAILLEAEDSQAQEPNGTVIQRPSPSMKESYIDVVLVERQDLLKVLPGARIPTDGIVVDGASSVDESMLTGEARKVAKEPGSTVIGGTINSQGVLVMRVTHTVTESMLARIVRLVDEAQSSKCVNQSVADGVASYFTTFIIFVAVVMFFVWYHLGREGAVATQGWAPFPFALRFAITILVISCPCAISLAVPTAILVGTTVGAHHGVLFKGGQALEALEGVDVVMFDKTGTLTTANLSVVSVLFDSQTLLAGTFNEVWSVMASAEQTSEHGIGKAIVAHAQSRLKVPLLEARGFRAVSGCGVQCEIDGRSVAIGSMKWLKDVLHIKIPEEFVAANDGFSQHDGCVVVFCAVDGALKAAVALKDAPRDEAAFVVDALRREKIQSWIVTGDQRGTALAVADKLGIPDFTVIADTLPHQKVEKVRLLQGIGKKVAFIGDGVNDAPALAMANVGIAIGAGADVAIDAADVVLVKDDLRDFLNALHLSRATNRMIRWNFMWAFLYNLIMMPVACGALYPWLGIAIPPALAGLSELLSSVPVILFSLLLNLWRPPFAANDHEHLLAHGRGAYVAIDVCTDGYESGDGCCSNKKANEKTPLLSGSR